MRRPIPCIVAALVTACLALACTTSADDPTADGTTTAPTAPTATSSPGSPTTSSAQETTTTGRSSDTTQASMPRCQSGQLRASLGASSAGAGQRYVALVLESTSEERCTLTGHPGVTLLDAAGGQIGEPATPVPDMEEVQVELGPGDLASAILHTVNAGMSPEPCWPPSASLSVVPPGGTDAIEAEGDIEVCGDTFTVTVLVEGAGQVEG